MKLSTSLKFALTALMLTAIALYTPSMAHVREETGLEPILKDAKLKYVKDPKGEFSVFLTDSGETSEITMMERTLGEGASEVKYVYLYTAALVLPAGFKHPYPMLKKMAELNDRFLFGKASISGPNGDVYYCSSFWLKNADKDTVGTEVALAHINRLLLKKELEPFTKNE